MPDDIVPGMLEKIERDFNREFNQSQIIKSILKDVEEGKGNYNKANRFAIEVGTILSRVFGRHITPETLPDGRMYFNIADRILNPTLRNNHKIIAELSAEVQEQLNKSINLGLIGIEPSVNQSRIDGFINRLSSEEKFKEVAWILQEPVVNYSQSSVDDTIKANVDFQGESGLFPTIIRMTSGSDPCDWCVSMAGVYKYPNVPDDVYRRHERCRCTVEYDPGDARRQDIWSKEWR